ncbi:hypothetical protein A9239_03070 [Methanosarcina sp. A14]|nr:hypothetical protein A9239_03070 [Methanosarcina sp. A14]
MKSLRNSDPDPEKIFSQVLCVLRAGKHSLSFSEKGLLSFPAKTLYKKTPSIACFNLKYQTPVAGVG